MRIEESRSRSIAPENRAGTIRQGAPGGHGEWRQLRSGSPSASKRLVCSRCGHRDGRMTPIPKLDPRAEKRERQNNLRLFSGRPYVRNG